jgi:TRAP-type C4-dicarboxylate transport system permease small subunit
MSFAAGLAMKNEFYVHLDMFYNRLPEKAKNILSLAIPVTSLVLFLVIGVYAIKFVILGIPEKSPSMGFNMGIAFFSMYIMSGSICYYLLIKIRKMIKSYRP